MGRTTAEQGDVPTADEVRAQLERLLASDTFAKKLTLSRLLERLVKDTLAGKAGGKGYEKVLAVEVFEKSKQWDPIHGGTVRQGMANLRDALDTYDSAEGADEPIQISFPKGKGYRAQWVYRRAVNVKASVGRLAVTFSHAFPDLLRCMDIVAELEACMREHPSYAPGHAILAEALLTCAMCDETSTFGLPQALLDAENAIKAGMALNKNLWHLHVVAGGVHCCRFAWDKADAAFKIALCLAPEETRAHFWYAAFLRAVGRTEEAWEAIRFRLKRPPSRLTPYLVPLFRYLARDFTTAFNDVVQHSPFFQDVASRFSYSTGAEIVPIEEWPAEILASCLIQATGCAAASWAQYAEAGVLHSKVGAFGGLHVYMCMKASVFYKALEERAKSVAWHIAGPSNVGWESPVSLALYYMARGMSAEAIAALEKACDMGHPLMVWLHLWPIFDPLREEERFKALIKRMRLPERRLALTAG